MQEMRVIGAGIVGGWRLGRSGGQTRDGDLAEVMRRGPSELGLILGLILAAGGLLGFVVLADQMVRGGLDGLDRQLLMSFRSSDDVGDPLGPPWLEEAMRDLTALGSVVVLSVATLVTTGFLVLAGRWRAALFVLAAIGSGTVLSFAVKHGFERPRPDLVPHAARTFTASFPSAHAAMSATAFLTLGALIARVPERRRLKLFVVLLATLLTVAVGTSRIYLGVHWPSDVLAGWALGGSWAVLCWTAFLWLQRRGRLEAAEEDRP